MIQKTKQRSKAKELLRGLRFSSVGESVLSDKTHLEKGISHSYTSSSCTDITEILLTCMFSLTTSDLYFPSPQPEAWSLCFSIFLCRHLDLQSLSNSHYEIPTCKISAWGRWVSMNIPRNNCFVCDSFPLNCWK